MSAATDLRDAWTVARKELAEVFGDRSSRRGALTQAVVVILGLGVLVPRADAPLWLRARPEAILLFLLLPAVIAGSISADAFAGERERKTLETLLAKPLSDRALVAGKAIAALVAVAVTALLSLIAAVVTVNVVADRATVFLPRLAVCGGALLGAVASGGATTAMAIALSLRTPVARAVQQMTSLLFVIPGALGAELAQRLGFEFTWPHVFELEAVAILVGMVGLVAAAARFHRDRLFVQR
jgi:ABC-2 type transport system permease protein